MFFLKVYTYVHFSVWPFSFLKDFIVHFCWIHCVHALILYSRIKEEKLKDNPKTIPLKVHAKDMGNFLYVSSLTPGRISLSQHSSMSQIKVRCAFHVDNHSCEQFRQRQWSYSSHTAAVWDCGKFLYIASSEVSFCIYQVLHKAIQRYRRLFMFSLGNSDCTDIYLIKSRHL